MAPTRRLFAAALLLACAALPLHAQVGDWPKRQPIKLVAVFPPGGSVDAVSRILAQQLTQQLGQTVIVENKVGASGVIGTHAVVAAPPDGYSYAVVFDTHGVNPSLMPSMPYDTRKDIAPVIVIGTAPMVIATPAGSEYKSFGDVLATAKGKKNVVFGSVGSGTLSHLAMAMLVRRGGLDMTHVPYKGGGPLMQDAVAGHVPLSVASVFVTKP
ncbi:MAG TPA: tripartite tricarboxylate transporter substrate-binding protein, partial [Ramlibacter sp.]|uniref:tripartite tricarboxylate transporter substrate-binding protein n=1 Tax=Ramlibacter sp. TaxID=1917967 RepID=UPI002D7E9A13